MKFMPLFFALFCPLVLFADLVPKVKVGADVFFEKGVDKKLLRGKKIGLISNQTALGAKRQSSLSRLFAKGNPYHLKALFAPEHGFYGDAYACEEIKDGELGGIPVYGLHGKTRRPTSKMLKGIDVLIYDIQDIGSRSYTYISTLFYCMEEASKRNISVIVLDRPNPMGGVVVDGFIVEKKWRSFLGYAFIPYCHGMTIGELAHLFNVEHGIDCDLTVIPMQGWKRGMTFKQTGLSWIPTSPQIPEPDTPFFYPTTGLLGHLSIVNIGVGYTLPFKLVGAPWIKGDELATHLMAQKLPGVTFTPFYFRPFFGKFKLQTCQGVDILITDPSTFLPVTTQYTILGVLKSLYPHKYTESMQLLRLNRSKKEVFHKLNGKEEVFQLLLHEKYFIWKVREMIAKDREAFLPVREKYLRKEYS